MSSTLWSRVGVVGLAAVGLAGLLAGCGGKSEETARRKYRIALILTSLEAEPAKTMAATARAHQQKNESLYELTAEGTDDATAQAALVEKAAGEDVDAIVIAPADPQALLEACRAAHDKDIVVVNLGKELDDAALERHSLTIPFVGPDSRKNARLAGKRLARELKEGDQVAIVEGKSEAEDAVMRKLGFEEAMNAASLKIVEAPAGQWTTEADGKAALKMIQQHPGLKGILCTDETTARGVVTALEQAGKQKSVYVVCFEDTPAVRELIEQGKVLCTVDRRAGKLGIEGIVHALDILEEKIQPGDKETSADIVTSANVLARAEDEPIAAYQRKYRIALVMKSLANEFFKTMEDGARKHQAEHADQYTLIANGIKDERDLEKQIALVEQMIAQKVDAIAIAPADSKALVAVCKKAIEARIVVVNIDNKFDDAVLAQEGVKIPFVGPDNRKGARLAGEYLAKKLQRGDAVAIVEGIPNTTNGEMRKRGFQDAMEAAGVKVVSSQTAYWETDKAQQLVSGMIIQHPKLKGVLCANDSMALGAVAALEAAGKLDAVHVVGFDNITAVQQYIKEGKVLCTIDQHADRIAVNGILYALDILREQALPEDKETPVDLITAENLR